MNMSYLSPLDIRLVQSSPSILVQPCDLRPVPTGPICRRPTAIIGRLLSADSRGFKILNMFDRGSRPTITESVVESADSAVESADYWSRPTGNWPSGYGPLDFSLCFQCCLLNVIIVCVGIEINITILLSKYNQPRCLSLPVHDNRISTYTIIRAVMFFSQ